MGLKKSKAGTYLRETGSSCHRKTIRINGKRFEKVFTRKQDADEWYAEMRREKERVEGGLSKQPVEVLVKDFAAQWLERRKANGKPLSSWTTDEQRMRLYVLPQFGSRQLSKISTREWEDFMDDLVSSETISAATRNRIRSLASKMYNDAIRMEIVISNPVRVIPKLKESMNAWDYWHTSDEALSYLAASEAECLGFQIFAYFALNTGTRVGEILALKWADINLAHRRLHIAKVYEEVSGSVCERTKGHCARWLGLNDPLYEFLLKAKNQRGKSKPDDFLVIDSKGKQFDQHEIRRTHWRVCERAGVREIRVHDLRHTYASHYIMNGGGLAELQMLLGHSTPQMTQKYAHLAPGFLESKAKVVSFGSSNDNVVRIAK
jgi:integrase